MDTNKSHSMKFISYYLKNPTIGTMNFISSVIFYFSLFLLFSSCITVVPPEFRSIDNFMVTKFSPRTEYKMDVKLFNPNTIGVKIKELNVVVTVFGSEMNSNTVYIENGAVRIPSKSDFTVPLKGETSMENASVLLQKGLSSLFGGSSAIPVSIKGNIIVKKFIFRKKIKFDFDQNVDMSKIKLPRK